MSEPIVWIRGFDPFSFSLPLEDPIPAGKLTIALPEVNVKVGRMDLLDWMVGGPMSIASIVLTLTEPMAASDLAGRRKAPSSGKIVHSYSFSDSQVPLAFLSSTQCCFRATYDLP